MYIVPYSKTRNENDSKYKIFAKSQNLSVAKYAPLKNREINVSRTFHVIRYNKLKFRPFPFLPFDWSTSDNPNFLQGGPGRFVTLRILFSKKYR